MNTKLYKNEVNEALCLECSVHSGRVVLHHRYRSSIQVSGLFQCSSSLNYHMNVSSVNQQIVYANTKSIINSSSCVLTIESVKPKVSKLYVPCVNNNNNNVNITNPPGEGSVINLSNLQLSAPMYSVLSKGLNFCPTPGEPDISSLRTDLDKFHVGLRRKLFFSKRVVQTSNLDLSISPSFADIDYRRSDDPFNYFRFHNPSSWCPPAPIQLESMIISNENLLTEYRPRAPKNQNLTLVEKQALAELVANRDIVIKPADKGSAVVIQNKDDYISEGYRQLSDNNFYIEVQNDLTPVHNSHVQQLIQSLLDSEEITPKCADYLHIENPRTPQLYLLPKIHKNKYPVPGRPIVSGNSCPTERISQLADYFLQPLVSQTASFVRDTTDFINKIECVTDLLPGTILCTIDVTSLYTNIPNQEGILACKKLLDINRQGNYNPSNNSILQMLEYVLTKNNFDFNEKHYLQVGGTAMGTKVAPSLANIFMANFEEEWVYSYGTRPSLWLRYIDDIFMIWEHSQAELDLFLTHLNSCHNTIKFTAEHSTDKVNFLDTTIHLSQDGSLYTDLFCKPTDSHNYLRHDSSHPKHCKTSLPYSQLLRVRRICTKIEDFDRNAFMLCEHFQRRGYPLSLVEEAYISVRRLDRNTILQPKDPTNTQESTNNTDLYLISNYIPQSNPLKDIVSKNWPTLGRTNTTDNLFSHKVVYGHRRNKNLRDLLVHARTNKAPLKTRALPDDPPNPLNKCVTKKCNYCPILDRSGKITSQTTGRTYYARKHISCKSHNLIYCITCTVCKKQYVGQTKNRLMDRFVMHYGNIKRKNQKDPIGRHFSTAGHDGKINMTIHILEFIPAPSESIPGQSLRDSLERKWIHRLQSIAPQGINQAD